MMFGEINFGMGWYSENPLFSRDFFCFGWLGGCDL